MPKLELQRMLKIPVIPARAAIASIVHDIADEKNGWAQFALYATLGSLGLPDVGYLAVPARMYEVKEQVEPNHEIRFRLQSKRSPDAFPTFDGAMGIDGTGASTSTMWLAGTYEVPMGGLGSIVNQTMMRGIAEKTLANMIDELAEAIVARAEKREMAETRYRLLLKSGD